VESGGLRPLKSAQKAVRGLLASLMSQIMGGVVKDRGLEAYQVFRQAQNLLQYSATADNLSQGADLALVLLS